MTTDPSFATFAELGAYLRTDVGPDDIFGQLCLDAATQAIRDYTRQRISFLKDDEVVLDGSGSDTLLLPESHVTAVTKVTVDVDTDSARDLAAGVEFDVTPEGLLVRRGGSTVLFENQFTAVFGVWPERRQSVYVKYSHGYDPVPSSVRMVCITCAARAYAQDGAIEVQTGTFHETYAGQPGELTAGERRVLDSYRERRK